MAGVFHMIHDDLGNRDRAIADLERFLRIEQSQDYRKQAQKVLELWRNPEKAKTLADEAQPNPHR